ncbi:protein-disulfide reductase DsbD domain-containing protein [uncultured Stenotrophomonas sp.]|uniref:protein-disulfide reductase DsbD domain-containing protein n=1 Tax=uncultured Stenotrophomonas sp. TaxID=165438 RepID=UPI0028EBF401|nr:protein-disulfide reductase DsbD domain-containing protein [uncultured Stenotrophomonas sp.]
MTLFGRFAALCALFVVSLPALAVSEKDLLPVDEAFGLSAQARDRGHIEVSWKIAPGYYLYRHRTTVKSDAAFSAEALQMPAGKKHHDDFFGEVETYRDRLVAVLPGKATNDAGTVTLEVRYQGCADAGVCYPPQKRSLKVKLPGGTGRGDTAITPAFNGAAASPFNTALGGDAAGGLRLPGTANTQALPLPSERAFGFEAIVGDGNTVLLRFSPAPGYYLYRDRTSLKLEGAPGIRADTPRWPAAKSHRDEHFGDVSVYFDQTEVTLPLRRSVADAAEATLVITFQGCQTDGICYPPMTRRVKLALPAGKINASADEAVRRNDVIAPLVSRDKRPQAREANGVATQPMLIRPNEPVADATQAETPDASADNAQRTPPPGSSGATPTTLIAALLLALAGGLILNLMPCVLPILSLKVLGVAQSGESRQRARSHALWYTAGVLVAFAAIGALVLALRAAGQAAGWGFQLQHPWFIAALVYLMFTVGLSLSGVFTLGGSLGGVGQSLASRSGPVGDFFTGVLACVVASPCVAPFMGAPLAYAFTAPALPAMLVFLVLGLGLALPFLLIGFVPSLARRLPRPGAWMETLKQVLAFPMYGTALWLLWVLGKQRGVDAMALVLAGLVVLGLALWWFERSRWRSQRVGAVLALVLLLGALVPVWAVTRIDAPGKTAAPTADNVVAYSPQMLDRLRQDNRVVFVNMTADWCVTCKANERAVLGTHAFEETLRRTNAVYMRGDYTNVDEQITAFLDEHKAVGVPLYVVYGPGAPPTVLPTVLTQALVEEALLRTAR